MVVALLVISVLGVVLWGFIDKKSLRKLSISTRIGIFTYLLALVAFSIVEFLTGQNEIKEISQIIGIVLTIYTTFVLFKVLSTQINQINMRNIVRILWKSVVGTILFGVLDVILTWLPLVPNIKDYGSVIVLVIAGLFGVFAVATLIVLLFTTLFPPKDEDED